MDKQVLVFNFEKETKGTVKFQEDGHATVVGTLYVKKHAFKTSDYPKVLKVTIEVSK